MGQAQLIHETCQHNRYKKWDTRTYLTRSVNVTIAIMTVTVMTIAVIIAEIITTIITQAKRVGHMLRMNKRQVGHLREQVKQAKQVEHMLRMSTRKVGHLRKQAKQVGHLREQAK